jgi:hypothetical protein
MFVGSVIPIGWRGIIVVCATIISRTMIIRSGIVFVRTVRPRTVSIGPVAIAAIGGDRAYDGAGRKAADDTGGSRSAVTAAITIISSATIATTVISCIGDQIPS